MYDYDRALFLYQLRKTPIYTIFIDLKKALELFKLQKRIKINTTQN